MTVLESLLLIYHVPKGQGQDVPMGILASQRKVRFYNFAEL